MDLKGEVNIPASRQKVWDALNDEEILRQSIPGCESLSKISDTELEALVKLKIGPVSAKFKGKVNLSDLVPAQSYRISGVGSGGAVGNARGSAEVTLADDGGATILRYHATSQVSGKLAQLGQRMIDPVARRLTKQFFDRFCELVDEEQKATQEALAVDAMPPSPAIAPSVEKSDAVPQWVWISAISAVLVGLLWYIVN